MFTVLLVDDEPWALAGLYSTFPWETLGFEVIGRTVDPREALKIAIEERPDVIFTDIRMPELTGLEMQQAIREQGIDAEFVFVSGYDDFEYARSAIQFGVYAYLLKPLNVEEGLEMLPKLHAHVHRKKQQLNAYKAVLKCTDEELADGPSEDISAVLRYVQANYFEPLTLNQLSRKYYMHATYLSEQFKRLTGVNLKKYIIRLRMEHAQDMLKETQKTISDIARDVGYNDYFYFIKSYQQYFGMTPYQYRKRRDKHDPSDHPQTLKHQD